MVGTTAPYRYDSLFHAKMYYGKDYFSITSEENISTNNLTTNLSLFHTKVCIEDLYSLPHDQRRGLTRVFTYYFVCMLFHI